MTDPETIEPSAERHSVQTRDRILDTAEQLFAEYGLQKVTTREITHAAAANVGAINYYFGSKEGLIEAVFTRRLTPMNQARYAALEVLEKSGAPPTVEEILGIMVRTAVEYCTEKGSGTACFGRLLGRALGETGETIEKLKRAHFLPVLEKFHLALQRAVPTLPREELHWRLIFAFGAMHFMLLTMDQSLPPCLESRPSVDEQVNRLVDFAARGLRAT